MSQLNLNIDANVSVSWADASLKAKASALSQQLSLPLLPPSELSQHQSGWLLLLRKEGLCLCALHEPSMRPIEVDFTAARTDIHGQRGWRQHLIAKAVGIKSGGRPKVLDVTAGLGRDALTLASIGCQVTMIERSSVMAALLKDALARLPEEGRGKHLQLIEADAIQWLQSQAQPKEYDVIYIDPMHPEREKTALVKKEMRIVRSLVGADSDSASLLEMGLQMARKRVVVKRGRHSERLTGVEPSRELLGKSIRFDIYYV